MAQRFVREGMRRKGCGAHHQWSHKQLAPRFFLRLSLQEDRIADIKEPALDAAVAAMRAGGASVIGVHTDVSKSDQIDSLAAKTLDAFGKVHLLCNNAGVGAGPRTTWELTKSWGVGHRNQFVGVIYGIQAFVRFMLKQDEPGTSSTPRRQPDPAGRLCEHSPRRRPATHRPFRRLGKAASPPHPQAWKQFLDITRKTGGK